MMIKQGVNLLGLRPEALLGMMVAASVLPKYGQELIVTSVVDGIHKRSSAHASGRAFDCRIWSLANPERAVRELKIALGDEFDVILERTHIHIEWDPKSAPNAGTNNE